MDEVKRFSRKSAEVLRVEKTAVCRFGGGCLGSQECALPCSLSRRSCLAISPLACSPGSRDSLLPPLSSRSVDSLKVEICRNGIFADLRSCARYSRHRIFGHVNGSSCRLSSLPCLYHSAGLGAVSWAFLRLLLSYALTSSI